MRRTTVVPTTKTNITTAVPLLHPAVHTLSFHNSSTNSSSSGSENMAVRRDFESSQQCRVITRNLPRWSEGRPTLRSFSSASSSLVSSSSSSAFTKQQQQQQQQHRHFHASLWVSMADTTTNQPPSSSATTTTETTTDSDSKVVETSPETSENGTAVTATTNDANLETTIQLVSETPPPTTSTDPNIRHVDIAAISPSLEGGPPIVDGVRQYSTPELTRDAQFHKAGLTDPTRPDWQNPLHHENPNYDSRFYQEDFATIEEFEAAVLPAPPLDNPDGTPMYPQYLHDLADDMVHLTMLEMNELLNRMADHYGFHEGILSPEGTGDGSNTGDDDDDDDGTATAAAVVEKTTFDVKLVSYDASIKIKIIKEVRGVIPGLGLKEAKELVEGAPVALQKNVSRAVAEQTQEKLVALGAVIEIV